MIDLQVHTTSSDGTWKLSAILETARKNRISYIAITDHDTIDAWRAENLKETSQEINQIPQTIISGVGYTDRFFIDDLCVIQAEEITCAYEGNEVHLLAYFLDESQVDSSPLSLHNQRMQYAHTERAKEIVRRINNGGYSLSFEELCENATSPQMMTRSFIAEFLLKQNEDRIKRKLESIGWKERADNEAVRSLILHKDSEFYASVWSFYKLPCEEEKAPQLTLEKAVELTMSIGGVPVLAHPMRYKFVRQKKSKENKYARCIKNHTTTRKIEPEKLVIDMLNYSRGIGGIEVYNSKHDPEQSDTLLRLAHKYNALYTAGTDFHGKSRTGMGLPVSDDIIENLLNAKYQIGRKI